jgi:phosphoglycerol transferase MdoB-like AlkP superfamily enzyme
MDRIFKKRILSLGRTGWIATPVFLFATAMLIIPIRGSFGVAPMNVGCVYFHPTNVFANHAAINVVWNFGYAVHKVERLKYPENYFDRNRTSQHYSELFPAKTDSPVLISSDKPNVMIIMLESYTFRFIEPLGGVPGIAPNFNGLVKEGILFNNFYSSGDRTDKGLISVLSGYPAQPLASIIKYPNKTKNLPFLNQSFKEDGYYTEFTYGYNIDYANFRSYLINAGFDHITHSDDFPSELNTSKWGVHDEFVFQKFFEETEKARQPFFKLMMTQSSHEPFEVPMETVIKGDDDVHKFFNSANYTDTCLGEFVEKAKKTDWWKNTLVIITADHGHTLPDNKGLTNPNRFKIPMLWLGGVLNVRDTVIHTVGGHPDIANTVLGQVERNDDRFTFSNNILSDHHPFAVYIFNNGFGLIQDDKYLVYDNNSKSVIAKNGDIKEKDVELGKSYVQKLYWDFNSR